MLFDEDVKEDVKDFFNREEDIDSLRGALVEGRKLILVLGIRRIGKSSLIRVVLNLMKNPYIYFDVRGIYQKYNFINSYSIYQMVEENVNKIVSSKLWRRFKEYLGRVSSIEISPTGIRVDLGGKVNRGFPILYRLLEAMDEWSGNEGRRAIIVFDEGQYLRYSRLNFRGLIAYIYDNLKNISLILSGSEVGLLHDFLGIDNPKSELYGRYYYEVTLERLSREESINFLRRGFEEYRVKPSNEFLEEAVNYLNGVIGWLVFFGRISIDKNLVNKRESIMETFIQGSKLVRRELEELFQRSRRYRYILESISLNRRRWSEIKSYIISKELQPLSDPALHELLLNLQKMGIIEKKHEDGEVTYNITDSILKYTIQNL
ncbi:MAG: ATP-binding protein [Candidatus Methanomethylicia archaeon]